MHFEKREIPSHAEPVTPAELKDGEIYFSVNFIDREMLIPAMEPFVFIGRDFEAGDSGALYFQDVESYRKKVRYQTATREDGAQFLLESENSLYLFEYERALEVLLRCSVRRGAQRGEPRLARVSQSRAQASPEATYPGSLRFEDTELQERLITELRNAGLSFEIRGDGAVTFASTSWPALNGVAHTIRDSCFRWYFLCWEVPESAQLFWKELKTSGLPFQVEHHDERIIFLLPRGSEDLHEVLSARVQRAAIPDDPGECPCIAE